MIRKRKVFRLKFRLGQSSINANVGEHFILHQVHDLEGIAKINEE